MDLLYQKMIRLTELAASKVSSQLLEGLTCLLAINIVHGDVSLNKLLLSPDPELSVVAIPLLFRSFYCLYSDLSLLTKREVEEATSQTTIIAMGLFHWKVLDKPAVMEKVFWAWAPF